jgi:hypothetical protein
MGYTTQFDGALKFTTDINIKQLAHIKQYMGEDFRDHPDWEKPDSYMNYIDLVILDDYSGIKWSGAEKTYGMVESVNFIIDEMKKLWPDFGLEGEMTAQGEEIKDVWKLVMENGRAIKKEIILEGTIVTCPHCEEEFVLEN